MNLPIQLPLLPGFPELTCTSSDIESSADESAQDLSTFIPSKPVAETYPTDEDG